MSRILLFILTAAMVSAGDLSLAEALRRADERNPSLLAQGYAGRVAGALVDQAGVRPNPMLDVSVENFGGTGAVRGADGLETTVQFSQAIERGGKREKRVAVARHEQTIADLAYAVRRAELFAATATAYVEVLAAQERLSLAQDTLALAKETSASVTARVKAAEASAAESARAHAALALARAEHARAGSVLTQARTALAATWGGPADDVPALAGGLNSLESLPDRDVLLAKLAGHPRQALQQATVSGRRASLQLAHAQSSQDVTVGGGVRFFREGSDAAFVAGVSVPIPFRGQNQGNIRAARETLAGSEQAARALDTELRTAFAVVWQEVQTARTLALDLRTDALPATDDALAVVRHAYTRGELPLTDVLEAQRTRTALRRELLDAETACATALVRLDALTDSTFPLTTALISAR
jgi:outer membrane protein, heavy metal efflux system